MQTIKTIHIVDYLVKFLGMNPGFSGIPQKQC